MRARCVRLKWRCDNRRVIRGLLLCSVVAWAALAGAAPHGAAASRADLQRWLAGLRASGAADVAAPLPWEYVFSDADGRKLEALSIALVRDGYRIASLRDAGPGRGSELRVVKVELHSAASLARRNRELSAMARAHGVAAYEGVDLPLGAP
jgi:hypothetical protein